jgi:hypothetical protein
VNQLIQTKEHIMKRISIIALITGALALIAAIATPFSTAA